MKAAILAAMTYLSATQSVHAGAWPREDGQLFVAAGGNFLLSDGAELPVYYDPTLYLEYGYLPNLTFGMDFYSADKGRTGAIFAFAASPIGPQDANLKSTVALGVGYRKNSDGSEEVLIRPGVSLGQAIHDGWLSFDGTATYGTVDSIWRPKADFTWGRSWSERWTTTLQIQTGQGFYDDHYAKVSPTVIYTISDHFKVNFGAVRALTGDKGGALKLETWITY